MLAKKAPPQKKKAFKLDQAKLRKYLTYAIISLALYFINKKFFLMVVFMAITLVLKQMRQAMGMAMLMFDPLNFLAAAIVHYWGIGDLVIFLFFSVFMADAIAGGLSPGSFLNYFLFHIDPILSNFLLGGINFTVMAVAAQVMYAAIYTPVRINYLGGAPFDTTSKAITNILFTYLYCVFFGDLMALIM